MLGSSPFDSESHAGSILPVKSMIGPMEVRMPLDSAQSSIASNFDQSLFDGLDSISAQFGTSCTALNVA